jgi:prolyl-tRNA synthetase
MIVRASQLYLPTLRDDPADAEAVSHKLLVRGGYIRQVTAGLWTFLPLGWRVHRKVEQIIREEMAAIGAQEMSAPVLTPAELWQKSGRYDSPEVFKLEDRNGRPFVLPLSHEETFTFHAAEIQSYRQLPQMWYHLQTKDRDEPRPKAGLLRVREFVMKDSYSFDRDEAGLDVSFRAHADAYVRIFDRCGLEYSRVKAESGLMGGSESDDFLAPAGAGENLLVRCENGDYAADMDAATGVPRTPQFPARLDAPEEIETPGVTTIEGLAELLSVDAAATSKAMPVVKPDGTLVLALVRGDDRLAEDKLMGELQSDFRTATGGTYAASRPDATTRRRSPTSARRERTMPAPCAAAGSSCRRRSSSGTSSSSVRGTPCRSAQRSSTRTAPRSRSSWAATGSVPAA